MYEYKRYVWFVGSKANVITDLNALAAEGWRVINIRTTFSPGEAEVYTLEREVSAETRKAWRG